MIVIVITVNYLSVHGCMHGMRVCVNTLDNMNDLNVLMQQFQYINIRCNVDVFL